MLAIVGRLSMAFLALLLLAISLEHSGVHQGLQNLMFVSGEVFPNTVSAGSLIDDVNALFPSSTDSWYSAVIGIVSFHSFHFTQTNKGLT